MSPPICNSLHHQIPSEHTVRAKCVLAPGAQWAGQMPFLHAWEIPVIASTDIMGPGKCESTMLLGVVIQKRESLT